MIHLLNHLSLDDFLVKYAFTTKQSVNKDCIAIYGLLPNAKDDSMWDIFHLSNYIVASNDHNMPMLLPRTQSAI